MTCRSAGGDGVVAVGAGAVRAASCCGGSFDSATSAATEGSGFLAPLGGAVQSGHASALQTLASASVVAMIVMSFVRGNFVNSGI
jgi:hypothetical protein